MLEITVPATELWDEEKEEFITTKEQTLKLEHSLVSLSKWESKWCKPFLGKEPKTLEETLSYIKCMTINKNVDPDVYNCITPEIRYQINEYIDAPMTATTFNEHQRSSMNREQITSELIYYWMITLGIRGDFQKWHLIKLIALIRVCNVKNQPPKRRSSQQLVSDYAALNAARRKKLNTKG